MSNDKVISTKKIQQVLKSSEQRSDEVEQVTTSAIASLDSLVTSQILTPEVADVVLADAAISADSSYLDELKFNEERVVLTIAEDTNSEYPIDPVPLAVNGKQIFVKRGEPTPVPRKYIECLCNPTLRVKTKRIKNNLGEDATVLERTRSLAFPFSVTEDMNPRGKLWLRALLTRE